MVINGLVINLGRPYLWGALLRKLKTKSNDNNMNRPKKIDYAKVDDDGFYACEQYYEGYEKALEDYIDHLESQKSSVLPSIISESEANGVCQHEYRDWRCDEEFQVCDKCKVVKFN